MDPSTPVGTSSATKSTANHAAGGADQAPSEADIETIAAFRYAIRRFLRFSEQAARREHITPQQHQLLLAVKGFPNRDYATVSELAHRLQMRQHSVVGLIDRTVRLGLVRRERGKEDRREVFIYLTDKGESLLDRLTELHRQELTTMRQVLANTTA
ncbi:MAG TPA: MarR family transcriptional regulator [Ktedonobacterales bacterium]|nr:MarR family transcriptional regulator [Ktedonobacterales bacterium]